MIIYKPDNSHLIVRVIYTSILLTLLSACTKDLVQLEPKLSFNPYDTIDFNHVFFVTSTTHEHCTDQISFQSTWERGIQIINPVSYLPSSPLYPLNGWNNYFYDWDETLNINSLIINSVSGRLLSFTDSKKSFVNIDSLPSLPNAEHVFSAIDFHICALGSMWSNPGWIQPRFTISGYESEVDFRLKNQIFSPEMAFDSLFKHALYDDIFITYNHPLAISETRKNLNKFSGKIQAVEIFNGSLNEQLNLHIRAVNDRLLTEGFRFWILAVLDHAEIQPQDRGLSVLLLPANYYSLSRVEKEKLILQSYINGHFYCSGLNTFHLKSFSATDSFIDAEFSEKVDVIKIITNKEETSYSDLSSIKYFIKPGTNYIRVEAHKNNNDFLFTQPVFYD